MDPRKWNHASSENVSCWSISSSTTDYRNQLQKCSLIAELCGYRAWITVVLQGLSFSNFVAVLALDFDTPVSWARRSSDFLGVCSSLAAVLSNFSVSTPCALRVPLVKVYSPNCELSAGNTSIMKFTSTFSSTLASRSAFHVPYRNTRCSKVFRPVTYHTAHKL
jgi:hypothetical protein